MSHISSDADLSAPRHDHAWRNQDGTVHATVRMSSNSAACTLYFDSAADARAVAAACTEAADALDKLAGNEGDGDAG